MIQIELPALRERTEDIPLLVQHFLKKPGTGENPRVIKIEPKAVQSLQGYDWPGNVRELENAIERATALCDDDLIRVKDLPPQVINGVNEGGRTSATMPVGRKLDDFIRDQERRFIEETVKCYAGNREKAARILGISMATLYRKSEAKAVKSK